MDNTKPEPEQQQTAEGVKTSKPTPEEVKNDSSIETRPDAEAQLATSSDDLPAEQGQPTLSLNSPDKTGTALPPKVSFPSAKSPSPPTDGQFGVVSTTGHLVCEFKRDEDTRPLEEILVGSVSLDSEPKTLGGSLSPPPQGENSTHVSPPADSNPGDRSLSTLDFSVDHTCYPEVYIAEEGQSPPLPIRQSTPMERGSLAPTSSTGDVSKTGYLGNSHMSMKSRLDVPLVTPLRLLGDQPDVVDCPFCMRRVETKVKKRPSRQTHIWGTILLFGTVVGAVFPYCCRWFADVEHQCPNCKRKIAQRKYNEKEFEPLGTQFELREVSRYEAAEISKKRGRP